jgi:hypothetical protein
MIGVAGRLGKRKWKRNFFLPALDSASLILHCGNWRSLKGHNITTDLPSSLVSGAEHTVVHFLPQDWS